MIPIVPALIPKEESDVKSALEKLSFSNEIHLDVVDGNFVRATSWPYQPSGDPRSVKPYTDKFTLEVDLMSARPLPAAVDWITAGADMLVFHLETIELQNFRNFVEFTHVSINISAHGNTDLDTLVEYAETADGIQLMGIKEIGSQGQPFDESVCDKIEKVKSIFPQKPITIDGSVNKDTIKLLADAGADRFIVGSAITLQENPQVAHAELSSLIN